MRHGEVLQAKLVDEIHLVLTPALLGSGEQLLNEIDLPALECAEQVPTTAATHVVLTWRG